MKQTTIKLADGTRYDLPSKNELEIVERLGMYFIKFKSGNVTRLINCRHVVWIKETDE